MEEKTMNGRPIVAFGVNNIGCDQKDTTFQTVVPQTDMQTQPQDATTAEPQAKEWESPVYLAKEPRGFKIDLIRVVNVLYMLGFFTGKDGKKITKKEVFTTIGRALNLDLTSYDSDLSRSLSDSTALEKHLSIFDRMKQKMIDVFNNYGSK